MNRSFFYILLLLVVFYKSNGQNFALSINENFFKTVGYLEICTDQINTGLFSTIDEFNFNKSFIDSVKLVPLKSSGFNDAFLFFDLKIKYPYEIYEMSYSLCYTQESGRLYKLKGFYNNDFYSFFKMLHSLGNKINQKYFSKKSIFIENIDMTCLLELYKTKKNRIITETDKQINPCLKYNFQPVIIY